jgi:tetratricopeptide (TPR) repeat protein
MKRGVSIGVLALTTALAPVTGRAAPAAEQAGRQHARRANDLAAEGRCKQAVPLFTKAYEALQDPALLFNRGECYRRLGEPQKALVDYHQFLSAMPKAPNRVAVEQRIRELDGVPPPRPADFVERRPEAVATAPRPAPRAGSGDGGDDGLVPARRAERAFPPPAPEAPETDAQPLSLRARPDREAPPSRPRSTGLPGWAWAGIVMGVVSGAALGAYGFWWRGRTDVPASQLGNFKF